MSNHTTNKLKRNGTSWQRSATAAVAVAAIVGSLLGGTASNTSGTQSVDLASLTVDLSSACWDDTCVSTDVNELETIALTEVMTLEPISTTDVKIDDTAPALDVVAPIGLATDLDDVNTMADYFAYRGWTGQGIDVAVIDSGVSPVYGLDGSGQVLYGPDLSDEAGTSAENLDTYGHGSHIAGIIGSQASDMLGGAPDSRIVSLKVAGASGETAVPQIIAAIDWVIAHQQSDGLNIRVINLSFGLDRADDAGTDPLMAAVDRAWDAGLVVVAAAGNRGNDYGAIDSPAASPTVIAVGSTTPGYLGYISNERVANWSNSGNKDRNPDIVVPGKSILSSRVPGSTLDQAYPTARVDGNMFKGSGTSQSSAVVSGWVAAILSGNPHLTPDEIKAALSWSTVDIEKGQALDGDGRLDPTALTKPVYVVDRYNVAQNYAWTDWYLDGVRVDSAELFALFSGGSWAGGSWAGGSWAGGSWAGGSWAGGSWAGGSWAGGSWAGGSWAGGSWAGGSWAGGTWDGN